VLQLGQKLASIVSRLSQHSWALYDHSCKAQAPLLFKCSLNVPLKPDSLELLQCSNTLVKAWVAFIASADVAAALLHSTEQRAISAAPYKAALYALTLLKPACLSKACFVAIPPPDE